MKNLFYVLSFHSFSDLITNSSTDIFACKTGKTKRMILEMLTTIHNAVEEENLTLDEFEAKIATVELQTVQKFYGRSVGWMSDFDCKKNIVIPKYKSVQAFIDDTWELKGLNPESEIIVLCGVENNSVPYWMQTLLENKFDAYRIHMG